LPFETNSSASNPYCSSETLLHEVLGPLSTHIGEKRLSLDYPITLIAQKLVLKQKKSFFSCSSISVM
jgi:hypothetical protein